MITTAAATRLRKTLVQTADLVRFVARREITGRLHVKQFERLEDNLIRVLTRFFVEQGQDVARQLSDLDGDNVGSKSADDMADVLTLQIYNPEDWKAPLVDAVLPWLASAMAEVMAAQLVVLGISTKQTTASEWLEDHAGDLVELETSMRAAGVPIRAFTEIPVWAQEKIASGLQATFAQPYWDDILRTTGSEINDVLKRGLLEGQSIRQMAKNMTGLLGGDKRARIRGILIARTESANALNLARKETTNGLRDEIGGDVPIRSVWLSVLGNTTRADHAALDGVPEDKDGLWNLGGQRVPWPGHYSLVISQRANCQCTTVVDFVDDSTAQQVIGQFNERIA